MARTRSIKPEFWSDEKVGTLSFMERLLFLGMWNFSDDEGLIKASPLYLKAMVFPYDNIKEKDIESAINNLSNKQLIFCFVQNNQQYAWIIKFRVYQRIDKPQKPNNPAPSIQNTKYRMAIFKRDNYVCHICGESTEISTNSNDSNFPTVDHLIPQSKGGNHYPSNLKTACSRCNKGRGDTDLDQFQEDSKNILRTFTDETETETETETEEKLNRSKVEPPKAPQGASTEIPYFEIIEYLNQKTGKNFDHQSKETRAKIKARWGINGKQRTLADFVRVIDNKCASWLNDPGMVNYLRPETLFGTKFESYLNEKPHELSGVVSDKTIRTVKMLDDWRPPV